MTRLSTGVAPFFLYVVVMSAYRMPQGYQADQHQMVYKMPRRHSTRFNVFAECRKDCASKCNHSLYAYMANKNECYTCLLECMTVFTEQAEKMGIRVNPDRSNKKARHAMAYNLIDMPRSHAEQRPTTPSNQRPAYGLRQFMHNQ